jgi:hypothetical protein
MVKLFLKQGISHQLGRDAVVRFECENSAIDVIINFLWKIFHKPIVLVVLTTANFEGFSNFCRYYTRSQTGKSSGYRPTLKPLYAKLSSAVGAILVEGPNCLTYFWKRTIQWLFHQHWVLIEQMVSNKKIFMGISHRVLWYNKFGCGGHLGRRSEMPDINLEGNHRRIISAKFGWDWLSSFRGEDFS